MTNPQIPPATPTPAIVATAVPVPPPVPHTEAATVYAIPAQPTPQQHASRLRFILSCLEGALAIGMSPEVMRLLPPKYQTVVAIAGVVDQATNAVVNPQP